MTDRAALLAALDSYSEERYRAGVATGLAVAERIRSWLTRQPDTTEQAEVRAWADAALAHARRTLLGEEVP